ncbi:MAG TPA: sensor histidine kinase, partial [Candidatus Acidoferrales bacterium]|nr:sensor histidine kinase [Candidatus Acidoferrales bacterium]
TDPARLLQESAEAVSPERIVVRSQAAPSSWRMDPARMQQVLTNVLRNAVQMSPLGESVEARVFADNGQLVYEVRDSGPGIPAGEEERIFEPFYTRKTRGTGLGLSLAQRIVGQHRGTITAQNHPAGGAVFRVALGKL